MSLEIIKKIRENDSLELALENALNKLKRAVKKRNDDLHLLNFVTVDDRNRPVSYTHLTLPTICSV